MLQAAKPYSHALAVLVVLKIVDHRPRLRRIVEQLVPKLTTQRGQLVLARRLPRVLDVFLGELDVGCDARVPWFARGDHLGGTEVRIRLRNRRGTQDVALITLFG